MRRHPNRILHRLFIASLIILAAMHPDTVGQMAELGTSLLLAIVDGITRAATDNPVPAALCAGAVCLVHQIRTHRPACARH